MSFCARERSLHQGPLHLQGCTPGAPAAASHGQDETGVGGRGAGGVVGGAILQGDHAPTTTRGVRRLHPPPLVSSWFFSLGRGPGGRGGRGGARPGLIRGRGRFSPRVVKSGGCALTSGRPNGSPRSGGGAARGAPPGTLPEGPGADGGGAGGGWPHSGGSGWSPPPPMISAPAGTRRAPGYTRARPPPALAPSPRLSPLGEGRVPLGPFAERDLAHTKPTKPREKTSSSGTQRDLGPS